MGQISGSRIGLALSGGAARAIAHLGVLEAFEEAGIPVGAISGTSGGSLIGALYASGKFSTHQLIEEVMGLHWWGVLRPAWPKRGLLNSQSIKDYLLNKLGPISFSDLKIPFAALACDLRTGQKVVLTEGPLAPAVQASCSLPVFFTPTWMNGRQLVDGGYVSQIPIRVAREVLKADFVIGVDVNYRAAESTRPPTNLILIAVQLAAMWARKNADLEAPFADTMIQVDVRGIGLTDLHKANDLLERGKKAAQEVIRTL